MAAYTYKASIDALTSSSVFKEASADELRVLLTVISLGEDYPDAERISHISGVSLSRTKAAITLFEAEGILQKCDTSPTARVIYEFESKENEDDGFIPGAKATAAEIRDRELSEMFRELEKLLEKSLSYTENGRIALLVTELSLTPHYILTLAAHLCAVRKTVTVASLCREARSLQDKGIVTLEELEAYTERNAREIGSIIELRRMFGIYGRALTPNENETLLSWLYQLEYSFPVIGEAYDICVAATGKYSYKYIDKVLKKWHEAGVKTLNDCRTYTDTHKEDFIVGDKRSIKKSKPAEADVPKYAEFNSEDALLKALARSYGDGENND